MKHYKTLVFLAVILMLPGCGVTFFSPERSKALDVQATVALESARRANAGELDRADAERALTANALYFTELRGAVGWFKPVYMNAAYTQLLERMRLTSDAAKEKHEEGGLSEANVQKILSHQAVNLMLFQDARDGRADESSDTYLARLYAKTKPPTP